MKPKVIMGKFRRGFAWQAPFITAVQTRIANLTKDEPKDQQYKLILAPADEQPVEKTPARVLVEYWEAALSQEELADMVERMKSIPPEQMKEMFKEWWKISAKQYLAGNELNTDFDGDALDILLLEGLSDESSSSETDES